MVVHWKFKGAHKKI